MARCRLLTGSKALRALTSLFSPAFAVLLTALLAAAVLLAAGALGLLELPAATLTGFASHLTGLAQVVAILNHVLATDALCIAFFLCHWKLLSPRPRSTIGEKNVNGDRLRPMPTIAKGAD